MNVNKIVTAAHSLLAGSGVALVADSLARLHGAAQVGGAGVGAGIIAVAAGLLASHSQAVAEFEHTVELDAGKVVGPSIEADVEAVKAEVAGLAKTADVKKLIADAKAEVESHIPAPAKVAVDDVRQVVETVLADRFKPAPATPATPAAAAPAAPVAAPPAAA